MPPDGNPDDAPLSSSSGADDGDVLDRTALVRTHAETLSQIDFNATPKEKLAFWRASKGDVAVATRRLRATAEWRESFGVDGLMSDPEWLERERECRRYLLLYDYLGTDRHGRPVMVERVGGWDVLKVLEAGTSPDHFLRLHCMACETLMRMERPPSTMDDRGQIIIMDCAGLSARHLDPRLARAFGRLATNDAEHYPDTLAHIWVVNAPYVFSALAVLVRPFMDPETLSKVHVSSGVPEELVDCVGAECLPISLGGDRRDVFPYDECANLSTHPRGIEDS